MDRFKSRIPRYTADDTDYTTNAPSYYDDLARKEKLIRVLAERIGYYDEELAKRFEEWDKNLEELPDELKRMFLEWVDDGTLARILAQLLLDEYATIEYVDNELKAYINIVDGILNDFRNELDDFKDVLENEVNDLLSQSLKKSHGGIYQKKMMKAEMGFNGNEIFTGADKANQGMAYVEHNGKGKIFFISKVQGDSWNSNERQRITEFEYKEDGSTVEHTTYSNILNLGHQGISAYVDENNDIILIAGANTGSGLDSAKGYSKIKWRGRDTNDSDVQSYTLFGVSNGSHKFEMFNHATPTCTPDGQYIILSVATTLDSGTRYCLVYDRKQVEDERDPLNTEPLNVFKIDIPPYTWGNVVQDLASDGSYIYVATGSGDPKAPNNLVIHEMNGTHLGYTRVDGSLGDYTIADLEGSSRYGKPTQLEPEGLTIIGQNLLYQTTDVWKDSDDNYTKRDKVIHKINRTEGDPINRGWQYLESPAGVHLPDVKTNVSYDQDSAFVLGNFNPASKEMREVIRYSTSNIFRFYDTRDNVDDRGQNFTIGTDFIGQIPYLRADSNLSNGSGINLHTSKSNSPGRISLIFGAGSTVGEQRINLYNSEFGNPKMSPSSDGVMDLGASSTRYRNIYTTDGAIKTSDKRMKQDIKPIDDSVLNAWAKVNYTEYRFIDSVEKKGSDKARKHLGLIAQDIIEAFESEGLNAFDYGLVGFDEWDYSPQKTRTIPDEFDSYGNLIRKGFTEEIEMERQAGSLYTIRADECLMLESALMRREIEKLKGDK